MTAATATSAEGSECWLLVVGRGLGRVETGIEKPKQIGKRVGDDKRPQLPPPPVNKRKDHAHRKDAQHRVDAELQMKKTTKRGTRQNCRPHPESLQLVNKIRVFQHLLIHRVDERDY